MNEYQRVLEVYSFEEVLELNDVTLEDCLQFITESMFITKLPPSRILDRNTRVTIQNYIPKIKVLND